MIPVGRVVFEQKRFIEQRALPDCVNDTSIQKHMFRLKHLCFPSL